MTEQEKITWLENATTEQLLDQVEWVICYRSNDNLALQIEGEDNWALVKAELMKRLSK